MKATYDKIFIRDLLVRAILGINESERNNKQDILINVIIYIPKYCSHSNDHIDQTINYRSICKLIINIAESSEFQLIESLAMTLFQQIFDMFNVPKLTLMIDKPHALRFAESVGIKMTRERCDINDK